VERGSAGGDRRTGQAVTRPRPARILRAALVSLVIGFTNPGSAAPIPPLADVPQAVGAAHPELIARRANLVQARNVLRTRTVDHNARCRAVEAGSIEERSCADARATLAADLDRHIRDSELFNNAIGAATLALTVPGPHYQPSGDALIGGMRWILGYNVQDADPTLLARARAMLRQQMDLAGLSYAEGIDFQRYNFVLGIADATNTLQDLPRAVLDELKHGTYSRDTQIAYASLKGRQFNELGCHSNGAMICLAALENQDIKADHVVLYGPQITPDTLRMWNDLVSKGNVKSVQVYINQNDPVPPVAMLFGARNSATAVAGIALFRSEQLVRKINVIAPKLAVHSFACGGLIPTMDCHDMTTYKAARGCTPHASGQTVPGTALPGKPGLLEPPAPC
jgi:hypothetical protein